MRKFLLFLTALVAGTVSTNATKLEFLKVMDQDYLHLYFQDGEITYDESKAGSYPATNTITRFGDSLNTQEVKKAENWKISSVDDANYATPVSPADVYRKSKLATMAQGAWVGSDFTYDWTSEHNVFLKLPKPLQDGKTYTITIDDKLNSDTKTKEFKFDVFNSNSEAIRINLAGYSTESGAKNADLYYWMGDGGARDYSSFIGKKVWVYDVNSKAKKEVGTVKLYAKKSAETGHGYITTMSDVWAGDFSAVTTEGTYRVVIEGVGASADFKISDKAYHDPFMVSVLGYYYMRIGEPKNALEAGKPVPRQPGYIPGEDPTTCVVYITDLSPYHDDWDKLLNKGDVWDNKDDWKSYKKDGNPTNPNAYGGHSDAKDWDRHLGHVSNIYDLLLPYILTSGAIDDDDLGIAESGNDIPDIIDEARNEVDFWLRLRYKNGYSHGLNNPSDKMGYTYQADNTTMAALANAANAAMIANCFLISGHTDLMEAYRDSASFAYSYANQRDDISKMLRERQEIGSGAMKGSDFKMMAAAYLYNITGDTAYENDMKELSVVQNGDEEVASTLFNQIYGITAYLTTKQTVNYPELQSAMKTAMIAEAKAKEADFSYTRPSRRASDDKVGWFFPEMMIQRTLVAHSIATGADKEYLKNALINEYDWTLGRNPLNMIYMTTATTPLEDKRSVEGAYTSGWDDGVEGVHPGHTPYMNVFDWWAGMVMGMPSWMTSKSYPNTYINESGEKNPENLNWPQGELYFNTRYVYCANEFTPRQSMRGKMALYAYLYGSEKEGKDYDKPEASKDMAKDVNGVVIFPNPSSTVFNVLCEGEFELVVFTSAGDEVYRSFGEDKHTFGKDFTAGVYFWQLETEKGLSSGVVTKF